MAVKVENIKTISFDYEIKSGRVIFTSDHHLPGDRKDPMADFNHAKALKFIQFQKEVVKGDLHVINGDFFEGWQFNHDDILKENRDILDLLLNSNVKFLKGNHDRVALENWAKKERVPLKTEWFSNRERIVARHGCAPDPANNDDSAWFGKFVTKVAGAFETIGVPIDEWYDWFTNIGKKTPSQVDDASFNLQEPIYNNFAKELVQEYDVDCVVLGHTHRPSLEEDVINGRKRVFANTGTWVEGKYGRDKEDCFVEIVGKEVRLNRVV